MKKTQINCEKEYKEYCFPICEKAQNLAISEAYGLKFIYDCYDTDEKGNDLDENGNIIPKETVENIQIADWVKKLKYPIILLEWVEQDYDRVGKSEIICVETVSIHEFKNNK